jgi:GldM C-terminal domain
MKGYKESKYRRVLFGLVLTAFAAFGFTFAIHSINQDRVSAVVLSRMNVFYVGVDNPISVSCEGVHPDSIIVSITGGSLRRDSASASYIVRVSQIGTAIVYLSIKEKGETRLLAAHKFRVKRIPDPVAYVNNVKYDGIILKEDLQKISGVFSRMENFDFDFAFKVISYKMSVQDSAGWREYSANGPAITNEMKAALDHVEEEQKIIFHGIITSGPLDEKRKISPVVITVK